MIRSRFSEYLINNIFDTKLNLEMDLKLCGYSSDETQRKAIGQ